MSMLNEVRFVPDELVIEWADGEQSGFYALWLRDHCQMSASRHPANGQRLINVSDFPESLSIGQVNRLSEDRLEVVFEPDGHRSIFEAQWLRRHCYTLNEPWDDRSESAKTLWQADCFSGGVARTDYDEYGHSREVRRDCLQSVQTLGFALLGNVPCESGAVLDVIRSFGFVRETNYGELFDVRSVVDPNNLAFSNLGLGCHADNPYRDPVPTVQLLHCLASSTEGGDSILVDGFRAAAILREEAPEDFELLTGHYLNYRFQDASTDLRSRVPMIELDDRGRITKVRYNNRSIDTILLPPAVIKPFYRAYRHYARILERPELKLTFRLNPGDLMVFDNTRIMHARTGYQAGGERHLQGAYADLDGLYSTLAVLQRETRPAAIGRAS